MACSPCNCRQTFENGGPVSRCTTPDGKRTFMSDTDSCSACQNYLKSLISVPKATATTSPARFTNSSYKPLHQRLTDTSPKPKISGSISSSNVSGHGQGSTSIPVKSTANSITLPPVLSSIVSNITTNDNKIFGMDMPLVLTIAGGGIILLLLLFMR